MESWFVFKSVLFLGGYPGAWGAGAVARKLHEISSDPWYSHLHFRNWFFFSIVSKNLARVVFPVVPIWFCLISRDSRKVALFQLSHQGTQKSWRQAGGPGGLVGVAGCEEGLSRSSARRACVNILSLGCLAVSLKNKRERGHGVRAKATLYLTLRLSFETSSTCVWISLSLYWFC